MGGRSSGNHTRLQPAGLPISAAPALAIIPGAMKTVTIAITGMSCQGCADTLARVLKTVPGVASATVSYPERRAAISFDARTVKPEALVTAVERAGFTAELP